MNRRQFLRGVLGFTVASAVPIPAMAVTTKAIDAGLVTGGMAWNRAETAAWWYQHMSKLRMNQMLERAANRLVIVK